MNFEFWRVRAEAEASDECVAARKTITTATTPSPRATRSTPAPCTRRLCRAGGKSSTRWPLLIDDPSLGYDLVEVIHHYQKCLDQDDLDLPKPFILQDILDKHERK